MLPMGPVREDESDLYVSDLIARGTGDWNIKKIRKTLIELAEEILVLRLSLTGGSDSYFWYPVASGAYSEKSGYAAASEFAIENIPQHEIITPINGRNLCGMWSASQR